MGLLRRNQNNAPPVENNTPTVEDDVALEKLGIKPELNRQFSTFAMLGLAFAILNSWTALASSLSLALPSGGPTSVIWGLVTAGICNLALAASLAEFLSAYPTAGGQYHWVAMISWKSYVPILSWITGWINVSGWIALVASAGLLGSQLIMGAISFYNADFVPQRWQQFLIYVGYTLVAFFLNAFANGSLPYFTKASLIWSIAGFAMISITILACAHGNYNTGKLVFTEFDNATGWPDGIAWLLGLLQAGLGLTGYDGVAHMIEEIPNPTVRGPKIMIGCVLIGISTGFIFLMCLLFVAGDITAVISAAEGPLLAIFFNATKSQAGSICLLVFPLVCLLTASISIMTTSSRMTYAFARDGGLPFSRFFARVVPSLEVPLNSLILTTILVIIYGLIFLGSSVAFNAILSSSVVALGVSYAIPPLINCLRLRSQLPASRPFKLGEPLGWACNILGIVYAIVTTVLFIFPPAIPVTGSSMNYCIVAFAIVLIVSALTWIFDGRKNYKGPQITLVAGHVQGSAPFDVGKDFDVDDQHRHGSKGGIMASELPQHNGIEPGNELGNGHGHELNAEKDAVEKSA